MQKTAVRILLSANKSFFFTIPLVLSALGITAGCSTTRPHLPLVIAREALASAKEVDAARYAPGYYFKAEEAFRNAMTLFNEKSYTEAMDKFENAREFAEKAETSARIQRQKSGDEAL
jgi:hypothetical protein